MTQQQQQQPQKHLELGSEQESPHELRPIVEASPLAPIAVRQHQVQVGSSLMIACCSSRTGYSWTILAGSDVSHNTIDPCDRTLPDKSCEAFPCHVTLRSANESGIMQEFTLHGHGSAVHTTMLRADKTHQPITSHKHLCAVYDEHQHGSGLKTARTKVVVSKGLHTQHVQLTSHWKEEDGACFASSHGPSIP